MITTARRYLALVTSAFLAFALAIVQTGCINEEAAIKAAISDVFEAFKNPSEENISPYLELAKAENTAVADMLDTFEQYDLDIYETFGHLFANFDYKINDVSVNGDTADVNMTLTNCDMSAAIEYLVDQLETDEEFGNEFFKKAGTGDESGALRLYYDKLFEYMDDSSHTVTNDVTIQLTKKDGEWNISDENIANLVAGIYGGFSTEELEDTVAQGFMRFSITKMFDALKSGDEDILSAFVDENNENMNQLKEYDIDIYEMMRHLFTHFDYEIGDIAVNEDSATVDLTVTNANLQSITSEMTANIQNDTEFVEQARQYITNDDMKGYMQLFFSKLYQAIDESDDLVTSDMQIKFTNTNGEWDIDQSSMDEFVSKVFGGFDVSSV